MCVCTRVGIHTKIWYAHRHAHVYAKGGSAQWHARESAAAFLRGGPRDARADPFPDWDSVPLYFPSLRHSRQGWDRVWRGMIWGSRRPPQWEPQLSTRQRAVLPPLISPGCCLLELALVALLSLPSPSLRGDGSRRLGSVLARRFSLPPGPAAPLPCGERRCKGPRVCAAVFPCEGGGCGG